MLRLLRKEANLCTWLFSAMVGRIHVGWNTFWNDLSQTSLIPLNETKWQPVVPKAAIYNEVYKATLNLTDVNNHQQMIRIHDVIDQTHDWRNSKTLACIRTILSREPIYPKYEAKYGWWAEQTFADATIKVNYSRRKCNITLSLVIS